MRHALAGSLCAKCGQIYLLGRPFVPRQGGRAGLVASLLLVLFHHSKFKLKNMNTRAEIFAAGAPVLESTL